MGALVVALALVVGMVVVSCLPVRVVQVDDRDTWNAYAMHLWLDGKPGFYPHELPDGRVRWYRVVHDEMVHGCPAAR